MPAGQVQVVLSVNQANYTKAMQEAQRQLDTFAGKARGAGHSTVSSMQAASASIRLLENPLGNNIRSIERLISQSKVLSGVLQAAFPLVGAIALGSIIAKQAIDVAAFITKVNQMPAAITKGFASLNLAAASSTDALRLTNDELQNSINKLEGKPQNNAVIAIDETRKAADALAESISGTNDKLNELLSQNHLSGWALLLGKQGTADREGTVKYYGQQQDDAALRIQQAVAGGDKDGEAKARADLKNSQNSELQNVLRDRDNQKIAAQHGAGNSDANIAIDTGVASNILAQQNKQAEEVRNADLSAKNKKLEADKAASQAALEARKKAAEAQMQEWETENSDWKAEQERSLLQDAAWWQAKLDTLNKGSQNFNTVQRKVNSDNIENNRQNNEAVQKFSASYFEDQFKTNGLSSDDSNRLSEQGKAAASFIQTLRESIDLQKQNSTAIAESSIQMAVATGNMTRLDAAQVLANLHTQDYNRALQELKDQRDAISTSPQYNDNPLARQAALQDNTNRTNALNANRSIQSAQDTQSVNPSASSPFVGATDALNEFVIASRDAAKQISEFTTSTISGFNDVLLKILTTRSTGFQNRQALGNFGAGLARNVAGIGLQHAEGTVLGALGFGGKPDGSAGKPLYVRIAGGITGAATTAASSVGNVISNSGGLLKSLVNILPHFAAGGPINGPALVGENGPELFNPGTSGTIIPNHQLSSVTGSTGHTFNIDARNSTDPAQTAALVQRGIMQLLPHIGPMAVKAVGDNKRRTSSLSS
jgi:Lambda phage tail tape-measure protein (Tape_meas_lam_C)